MVFSQVCDAVHFQIFMPFPFRALDHVFVFSLNAEMLKTIMVRA